MKHYFLYQMFNKKKVLLQKRNIDRRKIWLKLDIQKIRKIKHHNIVDKKDEKIWPPSRPVHYHMVRVLFFVPLTCTKIFSFFPPVRLLINLNICFCIIFISLTAGKNDSLNLLIDSLHYYSYENIKMQKLELWMRLIQQYISIKSILYIFRLQIHNIRKYFS